MRRAKMVDDYIENAEHWRDEIARLREILRSTSLEEDVKWGGPKKAGTSFKQLRKGLQREYTDYIVDAKRDDTKLRRVQKILPIIAAGKGLNEKYR